MIHVQPKPIDTKPNAIIAVGDKVKVKSLSFKYSNGKIMPLWVKVATLYVRDIEDKGNIYLISTEHTKPIYTGKIKATDVEKI